MSDEIRIGIVGYGNLGRGVEKAISQTSDMELVAIFTRRPLTKPDHRQPGICCNIDHYQSDIDVMILCGGSSTDLPEQGP